MVSDTGSHAASTPLPLLVLRLPEFEQIAWRDGKRAARRLEAKAARAFRAMAQRVLRPGDLLIHDIGTDVFAVLVAAPARRNAHPGATGCRAILQRIAFALAEQTGLRVETGWTLLADEDLQPAIATALERGARERERYEFFAAIGHELRTPLASIRGYLETLIESKLDVPTSRRFLQTAQREALRMGRLLDGMLEFSLLDLSAGSLAACTCDVAEQMALACDVVAPLANARSMTIVRNASSRATAAIDPDACLQLVVNLLENAIKYGNAGGTIGIVARTDSGMVSIVVDDDGPGVPAGERSSIFELRVRGSANSARQGAGLGLGIVKLIAERSGGSICVDDSPLGGARFEVHLPAAAPKAEIRAKAS